MKMAEIIENDPSIIGTLYERVEHADTGDYRSPSFNSGLKISNVMGVRIDRNIGIQGMVYSLKRDKSIYHAWPDHDGDYASAIELFLWKGSIRVVAELYVKNDIPVYYEYDPICVDGFNANPCQIWYSPTGGLLKRLVPNRDFNKSYLVDNDGVVSWKRDTVEYLREEYYNGALGGWGTLHRIDGAAVIQRKPRTSGYSARYYVNGTDVSHDVVTNGIHRMEKDLMEFSMSMLGN